MGRGAGGWIRTTEACASDLQSDPFGHSGTPAKGEIFSAHCYVLSTTRFYLPQAWTALSLGVSMEKMELAIGVEPTTC
jgi:hypothetical protein